MRVVAALGTVSLAMAVVAFGVPWLAFGDADVAATSEQVHRLETQARQRTKLPPLFVQTVEAESTGATPDHVAGTVVFRTLFGVETARLSIGAGEEYERHRGREAGVWGGFVAAEAVLLAALGWRLWTMP